MKPERSLAKCRIADLEIEDHGWLMLTGGFEYEDGGVQGLGYFAHASLIMRLMSALGVNRFKAMNGRPCWVTHTNDSIISIEPLHKKDGTTLIIKDWQDFMKSHNEASPAAMAGR